MGRVMEQFASKRFWGCPLSLTNHCLVIGSFESTKPHDLKVQTIRESQNFFSEFMFHM